MRLFQKIIAAFVCISVVLFSGCQSPKVEQTKPDTASDMAPQSDSSEAENAEESSASMSSSASSDVDPLADYTEITAQLEQALEGKAGEYDLLYADDAVLIFANTQWFYRADVFVPDIESYTYQLKAVDPSDFTLLLQKVIEETDGFLRMKGDKLMLLSADSVTVMGLQFEFIQEVPVPEAVKRGLEKATILPYNEVGSGYDPRNSFPKYDITADLAQFVYANDDGFYRYTMMDGATETLVPFLPPSEFFGALFYDGHFYAPSYAQDEKTIHGYSISPPRSGAHYSYETAYDVETGKLLISEPYYFTEQYEVDRYVEERVPYAPLKYVTAVGDGVALYCNNSAGARPSQFYLGADVDDEGIKAVLMQAFYDEKQDE